MTKPTRATTPGRVYLDLRARARREKRPTDELLVLDALERFLFRLSISPHRPRLVLKGGMLLAAIADRRPTRDIDLLADAIASDVDTISGIVAEIAAIGVADVGDPVTPAPIEVAYPTLLGEPFGILGYPVDSVLAEKLVTMVDRGNANTRDRDFADVLILIEHQSVEAAQLAAALAATATYRGVTQRPIADVLETLASDRQADWGRFLARADLQRRLPADYRVAIERVAAFADPILTRTVTSGRWDNKGGVWTS